MSLTPAEIPMCPACRVAPCEIKTLGGSDYYVCTDATCLHTTDAPLWGYHAPDTEGVVKIAKRMRWLSMHWFQKGVTAMTLRDYLAETADSLEGKS